jgi:hypothetical protein
MAASFTFGAAMTLRVGGHIRVLLLLKNAPAPVRRALEVLSAFAGFVFMAFLTSAMVRFAWGSGAQLAASDRGHPVVLRLTSGVGDAPLVLQPAAALQPVQRGIERALLHVQGFLGGLTNPAADAVSVHRAPGEGLEDEDVERAYVEVASGHAGGSEASVAMPR